MSARFWISSVFLVGVVVGAFVSLRAGEPGLIDIFVWLGLILVACAVALWPIAGRDERAELKLDRTSWADRVEFREPRAVPRSGASERGSPVESRTWRVG